MHWCDVRSPPTPSCGPPAGAEQATQPTAINRAGTGPLRPKRCPKPLTHGCNITSSTALRSEIGLFRGNTYLSRVFNRPASSRKAEPLLGEENFDMRLSQLFVGLGPHPRFLHQVARYVDQRHHLAVRVFTRRQLKATDTFATVHFFQKIFLEFGVGKQSTNPVLYLA